MQNEYILDNGKRLEKLASNIPCEVGTLMNVVSKWSDLTMCGSFHENWFCFCFFLTLLIGIIWSDTVAQCVSNPFLSY